MHRPLIIARILLAITGAVCIWTLATGGAGAEDNPPSAPLDLTAIINDTGTAVTLAWAAPAEAEGVTGYRILRRRPGLGENELLVLEADTGSADTQWIDRNATEGFLYVYRVQAINAAGVGAVSNNVKVRVRATITATIADANDVVLSWNAFDDTATGYQIIRRRLGNKEKAKVLVEDTGSAATTWTDATGIEKTSYSYRIKAINPNGIGIASRPASVSIPDVTPPSLQAATVNGPVVTLTFNETMAVNDDIDPGSFVIDSRGPNAQADPLVVGITVDGAIVTLRLAMAPWHYYFVSVSYEPPSASPLTDLAGNPLPILDRFFVTNLTPDLATRCRGYAPDYSDPFFGCQWHLRNTGQLGGTPGMDLNVIDAWAITQGEGIKVAVVDSGLDHTHPDLSDNADPDRGHSYYGTDLIDYTYHGTAVTGVIAMRDNNIGGRGIAPRATVYGYALIEGTLLSDADQADAMLRHMSDTAVSNNSWGSSGKPGTQGHSLWERAIDQGVSEGFGGRGVSYIFIAHNDYEKGFSANDYPHSSYYGVTAVCGINDRGIRAKYSQIGSNLWVCGLTSDYDRGRPGAPTTSYARSPNRYLDYFGGTSSAAPQVSGVVALMRAANGNLTWRDVKLILAATARQVDMTNSGWEIGAPRYDSATERYYFNHEYGFGLLDATAAVKMGQTWTNVPALRRTGAASGDLNIAIPDPPDSGEPATVAGSVTVDSRVEFTEFVEVNVDYIHPDVKGLTIELVSPNGAVSVLRETRPDQTVYPTFTTSGQFRYGSARHLGENPSGAWTLRISDQNNDDRGGTLASWSITVYGHGATPCGPRLLQTGKRGRVHWGGGSPGADDYTAYDLRFIASDAPDKADANWTIVEDVWTSGELHCDHVLAGLSEGTDYDVQLRTVSADGDGSWSASIIITP